MEAKAIEALLNAGANLAQLDRLPPGAVSLPQLWQIIDTEKFQAAPLRHRRTFTTTRLNDFLAYSKQRVGSQSAIFIAPDLSNVVAIINHGSQSTPDWGDDTAKLEMKHSPAFRALQAATQRELSQQQLIDLLEDWGADGLSALGDDAVPIPIPRAIAAVRRVKIEAKAATTVEQGTMRAARSSMEEIEATGADDALPALLRLWAPMFESTDPRIVNARISVLTGSDKPRFALRLLQIDAIQQEIAREVEAAVRQELTGVDVFVGSSSFAG